MDPLRPREQPSIRRRTPIHVLAFWLLAVASWPSQAWVQNVIQNCVGSAAIVGPPPVYVAGDSIYVLLCRSGALSGGAYLGTYTFSSTDTSVVVPPPHTYTLVENTPHVAFGETYYTAWHYGGPTVVFLAPGRHMLTLTFTEGGGAPGFTFEMQFDVIAPEVVPAMSPAALAMLALLVAFGAAFGRRGARV